MQRDGTAALSAAHRYWARLEDGMNLVAAAAIFFLMFVGVFQIIGRTVFNTAIYGYIDYMEQASALFAFLGISYAQRVGAHIRMDLLLRGFSHALPVVDGAVLRAGGAGRHHRPDRHRPSRISCAPGSSAIRPSTSAAGLADQADGAVRAGGAVGAAGAAVVRLHAPGPPSGRRADRRAGASRPSRSQAKHEIEEALGREEKRP